MNAVDELINEDAIIRGIVAALRRAGFARSQAVLIAKSSLPAIQEALREIVLRKIPRGTSRRLPNVAPERYEDTFKERRNAFREQFLMEHGRPVIPLTDEDFTPVRYYMDVWGPVVKAAEMPVTTRYLGGVDPSLFNALEHFIRQSQRRVRGRKPVTFAELGIVTDREAIKTILPTPSP